MSKESREGSHTPQEGVGEGLSTDYPFPHSPEWKEDKKLFHLPFPWLVNLERAPRAQMEKSDSLSWEVVSSPSWEESKAAKDTLDRA